MVSPGLIKKKTSNQILEVNDDTKKLFQVIYAEQKKEAEPKDENIPRIAVSQLISKLSFFYEKIRNAVDYEEDHLLRKNAIARILKRQVIIEGVIKDLSPADLSQHLLTELIRGGYLPNNEIPEVKIKEVTILLDKYLTLKNQVASDINRSLNRKYDASGAKRLVEKRNNSIRKILGLAACEIEEVLAPDRIKKTIVSSMFSVLQKNISLPANFIDEPDLDIQIYLSIGRRYLKFDPEMLSFALFKFYNGSWLEINQIKDASVREREIKKTADKLDLINTKITEQLNHPLGHKLDKVTRKYALYYNILADTISQDPVKAHQQLQQGEKAFKRSLTATINQKYKKSKSRLWRAAVRSIIYIFLTKSIFVVLIEVPAIKWFGETINYLSLGINITFPAVLLFLIVLFTAKPGKANTEKIISGIFQVMARAGSVQQTEYIKAKRKRHFLTNLIFNLIYTAAFIFSVYLIIRVLSWLNFTWVSMIVFLFFLAFVSFFSVIVSRGIKDLLIVERKDNLLTFIIDLFYMPIILVGRWLSNNISRVNIFIFVFDFIIEAPFKILVEVAEDWTKYVRERRDNVD